MTAIFDVEKNIVKRRKMLLTIILSFYDVFKNLPFLDLQITAMFGTQTYTSGIDLLLSKKCF